MSVSVQALVQQFNLARHPEGGYYRETYRSAETIGQSALPARFTADRVFATAIYFLVEQGNFSAFHRIKSDECWHFYAGQSLYVHVLHPAGEYELIRLGADISPQAKFSRRLFRRGLVRFRNCARRKFFVCRVYGSARL
jgi:predicted cupin superfamily sugar epimerase